MQMIKVALAVSSLAAAAMLSAPANAASKSISVSSSSSSSSSSGGSSTSVANSVTIVVSNGKTVVKKQSCTGNVSGYVFQSLLVIVGGGWIYTSQSSNCYAN